MRRLAKLAAEHPHRVLMLGLLVLVVAGVFGASAASRLEARNAFADPSSSSARAEALIEQATGRESSPGVVLMVDRPPSSPAVALAARTLAGVPGVAHVETPDGGRNTTLMSDDRHQSLIVGSLSSAPHPNSVAKAVEAAFKHRSGVVVGGTDVANQQVGAQANRDLGFAELLAFPLLLVLTLLVFRGVAAVLPVSVGVLAVLVTFAVLRALNAVLPLSTFSLNLVIGLGLGLAVDWSLLVAWRFREELSRGRPVADAMAATLATAGRTVMFSTITVAAAMASLLVFPQRFLVSMALGGMIVAVVAGTATLVVLPSLAVLLAGRIGRVRPRPDSSGLWHRLARRVMHRPALVAVGTLAVLVLVGSPALGVHWSGIDASVLPTGQSARVVSDTLAAKFPAQDRNAIVIAARAPAGDASTLDAYASRLGGLPGVTQSSPPAYLGERVWRIELSGPSDPISAEAQQAVHEVRTVHAPVPVEVGGQAADFVDEKGAVGAHLLLALVLLGSLTLLVLWAMTGSVVLPVKALVMNALTVAAATGLLVFVFQHGRLTGLLDYHPQGGIEITDFLVLGAIVFALSTDYGVLLLTRIKEAHEHGLSDRDAVARGLQRTGRLVTAAALLLAVAIGAFSTSHVIFLKEVGIGVAAAVLIDAFIVRALLVPSLMALLGWRNWWQPAVLRRFHDRLGLAETNPSGRGLHALSAPSPNGAMLAARAAQAGDDGQAHGHRSGRPASTLSSTPPREGSTASMSAVHPEPQSAPAASESTPGRSR
ncbi:MAG: MMPL family transporter [Acidimicrobiaceae bacterium]|nr:MMPL family transporter [Acidimicrobiaceae bacterium]